MTDAPRQRTPVSFTDDRNFDDLAPRFARNIYGGLKGRIRLEVLRRDFAQVLPGWLASDVTRSDAEKGDAEGGDAERGEAARRRVLDAGGGQGQFSLPLAAAGHDLTLCDLSSAMLELARAAAAESALSQVTFRHASIQELARQCVDGHMAPFDLVICHSVLEWVADQPGLIVALAQLLRPGGVLSLTFYNRHGLVMKNLLRGRRPPILDGNFTPSAGSLTPTRPLDPQDVLRWLGCSPCLKQGAEQGREQGREQGHEQGHEQAHQQRAPWELLHRSGIRVFHDLLLTPEGRAMDPEQLVALELELSLQEPYLSLGRYQHILARKR